MVNQTHSKAMPAQIALYDQLGGVYAIAAVMDDFIDRIMDNPRLDANPKVDAAHHRVFRAGFKYLATELVCWATGGPELKSITHFWGTSDSAPNFSVV